MATRTIPPDALLEFFELDPFSKRWERYNFPEEELGNLQIEIMADPQLHPVIQGTRGLRKMRFSPVSWPQGKRAALRVCYVYFERLRVVVLVIAYAKNELDDIPQSMKPAFNAAIKDIETQLEKVFAKGSTSGQGKGKRK